MTTLFRTCRVFALLALLIATSNRTEAATVTIQMFNNFFSPANPTINVGDTVVWLARSSGHDTVSVDGLWASPNPMPLNSTFSFKFNTPGSYGYFCTPHRQIGMVGTITVVGAANQSPTVTLTSPANGATFLTTDTITFSADANDPDGSIAKVEFFSDGNLIGSADTSAPYSVTGTLAAGSHSITAKATDNAGAATTSTAVTITVSAPNQPPTVTMTAPGEGATFLTTDTITFSANATDDSGITKVEFFFDGILIGTDTSAPYEITASLPAGSHSIAAKATDNAGASTTSSGVTITVNTPNQPPTVTVTAPGEGATFLTTDTITFSANATDDSGITKVEFFSDGILIGTDTSAPYEITASLPAGSHSIAAKATDNGGASTTSAGVTITVNAANQPPSVTLTAPGEGATFLTTDTITFSANATDDSGITKVEFFSDGVLIGTATSAPFSVTASLPAGAHSIAAKATDNGGLSTTSSGVSITVNAPTTAAASHINSISRDGSTSTIVATGTDGVSYDLEATTDFVSWTKVMSAIPSGGTMTLTDTSNETMRYYRVVAR